MKGIEKRAFCSTVGSMPASGIEPEWDHPAGTKKFFYEPSREGSEKI